MLLAILVFVVALALIASERVDRTKIALLGATIVVLTRTLDQEQAIEAIDFNTIGLLVGMMIMVRVTETTGVYTWLAIRAGQLVAGPAAGRGRWRSRVTTGGAVGVPRQRDDDPARRARSRSCSPTRSTSTRSR